MNISEQELRAMVRDAIARQTGSAPAAQSAEAHSTPAMQPSRTAVPMAGPHPSHGRLALVVGGDAEGRCLIEPAVACTHCGYCQSLGH